MANCVDPDQMLHSAVSDLGQLFAHTCLSEYLGLIGHCVSSCGAGMKWGIKWAVPWENLRYTFRGDNCQIDFASLLKRGLL